MGSSNRRALVRFLAYVRPYLRLIGLATLCGMAKFILPSSMALTLKFITDRLVRPAAGGATDGTSSDVIVRAFEAYLGWATKLLPAESRTSWGSFNVLVVTLLVIYAVWAVALYYRSYLANLAGHRTILDLRTDLFQHLSRLSHSFFQAHQSGAIVSRLMADVALAQNFVGNAMINIWMDLVTCIFYIYVLFAMDTHLAIAAMIVFPFYVVAMRGFGPRTTQTSRDVQEATEILSGEVQERVANIHVIKIFRAEKREVRSFFARARNLFDLTMRNVRVSALSNSLVQWLTQMATLGMIWYGSYRLVHGKTSMGTVIAFILLLRELYFPVNRISELNSVLHNSLAAIERVFEFLDTQPDVKERPDAVRPETVEGGLRFENVTFGYQPSRPVLHDLELTIRPGEVIALVGPSGAGKSSLIQLVPRFYDPEGGRVLLDGRDIRTLPLRHLRAQVAMVSQETLLFSGTAKDNIRYGRPDASDVEVRAAAEAAHAHEFITALPQGYESLLGERGCRLSGGQKQRIAIARAFLADPRILILDEATSALDSESEALIQDSLAQLMRGRTSIVIAHRLSTILGSDRIAVMDRGRVVEVAPHEELLARGGLYARLYHTQFRGSSLYVASSGR
ncbi:MAG: multidrug transporter ATP-binding protein [Myxococcales bacterium]|nr:multidrug transporter ATP-binding protein [Myxococcales bacterium]